MSDPVPAQRSRTFPLLGVLMLLCGFGLLLVEFQFSRLPAAWSQPGRMAFLVVMALLVLGGTAQIIGALISPTRRRRALASLNRNRVLIPREGVAYLTIMVVLFIGALLGRSNMLLLVFALMPGPFVLNGSVTFTMLKRAAVGRNAPRRAMVGELFPVELTLHNRNPVLSAWVMSVRDEVTNTHEHLEPTVLFVRVPPRGSASGHYQLQLMRRGRHELGPVQVATRFPLGLVERARMFNLPGEILAYPRIGRLATGWVRELMTATELVQQTRPRGGMFDDEFHRLREYRPGDNPRAIHWRSSARRNGLIVREFQQNREYNLTIVIDLWQTFATAEQTERVELAMSFAATVCLEHFRNSRDSTLQLKCGGRRTSRWEGRSGPVAVEEVLDFFALAESGRATDTAAELQQALETSLPDTRVLLVTTRPLDQGRLPEEWADSVRPGDARGRLQVIEAAPKLLETIFFLS